MEDIEFFQKFILSHNHFAIYLTLKNIYQKPELCPFLSMPEVKKIIENETDCLDREFFKWRYNVAKNNVKSADMCTYMRIQFEEFAQNLEKCFVELGKNLHGFKNKVTEIKQSYRLEPCKKKQKNRMFKKVPKPRKKIVKNESLLPDLEREKDSLKSQFIGNFIDINTIQLGDVQDIKTVDLTGTLNPTLDFDINEWFSEEKQNPSGPDLFKEFFNIQSTRVKKSDPFATQADIKKFVQSKWDEMSQFQRARYVQTEKKREQAAHVKSNKKPFQKNKDQQTQPNRFSQFLDRKATKTALPSSDNLAMKKQSAQGTSLGQSKVSASGLLSALKQDQNNKQLSNDSRLGWIFSNFQF